MKHIYAILSLFILLGFSSVGWGQSVTTVAATDITGNSATLNASASGLDAGKTYYVIYYYGPTDNHYQYNLRSNNITGVTTANFPLATDIELSSNTEYFFTAYLWEADVTPPPPFNDTYIGSGAELSFTTEVIAIGISTNAATNITINGATLNATASGLDAGKTYYTEYYYGPADNHYQYYIKSSNVTGVTTADFPLAADVILNSNTEYFFTPYLYEVGVVPPFINTYIGSGSELSFTTALPLDIATYTPLQNATNVLLNLNPQLIFNQNIQFVDPIPFSGAVYIREQGTNNEIQQYPFSPGTPNPNLIISGSSFTIELSQELNANTATYITIPSGIIESITDEVYTGINNAADNNWRFTTIGPSEWATGYPTTTNLSMTSVDIVGQTDKAGTYYYVVSASATEPTISQIKNGLNASGTEAMYHNSAAPGTMVANTEFVDALNIDGIDIAPTTYYVFYVAVSDAGLDSSIGSTSFTTVERDAPTATFIPANGAIDVSVSSSISVTYDEPVRNLDGSVIDDTNVASLVSIPGFSDYSVTIDATKQILTITPNSPLASNTTYSVVINQVEDWFGNEQYDVMSSIFTTADFVTWNGSVSSDWDIQDNWTGTLAAGVNVLIPASGITNWPNVTTNTSNYVHDIILEAGAELNISSSGTLLVTGYFILESANDGKGNASLLNNGILNISSTNKVQIQQNVTDTPVKWYYISPPVTGATQASIGCDGSMQIWDTTNGVFSAISSTTALQPGRGYRSWSNSNMVFSGPINNGAEYSYTATQTSKNPYGWECVGNPYPCSVDWTSISNTGLLDAFWIWINDQAKYGTYNGNSLLGTNLDLISPAVIPSNQAFWVRVAGEGYLDATGTVTIPKAARSHNQTTYLKSAPVSNQAVVRLVAHNGEKTDEVVVAFIPEASDVVDVYDSEKRFAASYAEHLDIYSFINEDRLTINSYSELIADKAIPLGLKVPFDGNFEISLSELRNISDDAQVLIEDKVADTFTDMRIANLVFTASEGFVDERFLLHVKPNVATSADEVEKDNAKIYSSSKTVYIEVGNLTNPTYNIYTLSGQLIMQGQLRNGILNSVDVNYEGVVIVTISSKEHTLSQKVFVK